MDSDIVTLRYEAVFVFPVFSLFGDAVSDVHVRVLVVTSCLVVENKKCLIPSPREIINTYKAVVC